MATVKNGPRSVNRLNGLPSVAASKAKALPETLIPALLKGLVKVESQPLQPGKHQVRGTVTVHVDGWLTKAEATTVRQTVPVVKILSRALEYSGLTSDQIQALVTTATVETLKGTGTETPIIDAALESAKELMPSNPREGACPFAGEVEIVDFQAN